MFGHLLVIFMLLPSPWALATPADDIRLAELQIPQIAWDALTGTSVLGVDDPADPKLGKRSALRIKARLENQFVNLKVTSLELTPDGQRTLWLESLILEHEWYRELSRLGIHVPRLRGITQLPSGAYALVTDFIEGLHFSVWGVEAKVLQHHRHFRFTEVMLADVQHALNKLSEGGIVANDVQFRLSGDGRAYLIDPEMFGKDPTLLVYPKDFYVRQIRTLITHRRNLDYYELSGEVVRNRCQELLLRVRGFFR